MSERRKAKTVAPGQGHWLTWSGGPVRYLALGEDTEDRFALNWGSARPGSAAPPHRHTFAEGFYVLSGEMTFTAGNRTLALGPGGFLHIGAGTAHFPKNNGTANAEVLVLTAPAGFDRYQREVAAPGEQSEDEFRQRLEEVAPRHGIDLHPPPSAFEQEPVITVRRPGEGRRLAVVGDLYTVLIGGDETEDRYALIDAVIPPGGGPPPHRHNREEEFFYVLDGELTCWSDDAEMIATPRTFLHLPRGTVHHFKNRSDRPARTLIGVAPAGLERMFAETGADWTGKSESPPPPSPDDVTRLLAVAPRYGIDILAP